MAIYLITDTHFNWDKNNITNWRPVQFQYHILDNWNKIITDNDTVFHLGDVIMNRKSELSAIMDYLNGTKVLIKGNHDIMSNEWYIDKGFSLVVDKYEIIQNNMKFVLSHQPIDVNNTNMMNIHGHFHDNCHSVCDMDRDFPFYNVCKNFCLSLEWCDYKPILLEDFIHRFTNVYGETEEYVKFKKLINLNKVEL